MSKLQKQATPQSSESSTSSGSSATSAGSTTSNSEVASAVPTATTEQEPQGALGAALKAEQADEEGEDESLSAGFEDLWDMVSDPAGTGGDLAGAAADKGESVYDAGAGAVDLATDVGEAIGQDASAFWEDGEVLGGELDVGMSGEEMWDASSEWVSGAAEDSWEWMQGEGEAAVDLGSVIAEGLVAMPGETVDTLVGTGQYAVDQTLGAPGLAMSGLESTWDYVSGSTSDFWEDGDISTLGITDDFTIPWSGEEMWDASSEWVSGAAADSWDWMSGAAGDTAEWMGDEALPWMAGAASDTGDWIGGAAGTVYDATLADTVDGITSIPGSVEDTWDSAYGTGESAVEFGMDVGEFIGDNASSFWDDGTIDAALFGELDIGMSGSEMWDETADFAGEGWETTSGLAEDASEAVVEAAGWIGDTAQEIFDIDTMSDAASDAVEEVTELATDAWEFSSGMATDAFEGAMDMGEEAWREADEMLHLSEVATGTAALASEIIDQLPSVDDVCDTISGTASDAWDASYEVMGSAVDDSTEWIGGLATDVSAPIQDFVLGGVDLIEDSLPDMEELLAEMGELGSEAWGSVTGWSGEAWDQVGDWAEDFGDWSMDFGESALEGMTDLWDETAGVRDVADSVISEVSAGMETATDAVESAIEAVEAALEAAADAIASFFSGW